MTGNATMEQTRTINSYEFKGPANNQFSRIARLAAASIVTESQWSTKDVDDIRLLMAEIVGIAVDNLAKKIKLTFIISASGFFIEMISDDIERYSKNEMSYKIFSQLVGNFQLVIDGRQVLISGTVSHEIL